MNNKEYMKINKTMKTSHYWALVLTLVISFNNAFGQEKQQIKRTNNLKSDIMENIKKNSEIEILVEFTLKPGVIKDFEAILLPHLERVASEETCLLMAASRDENDETKYILYERWKDEKEFWDVQMKRAYRIPYNENIAPFEAAERKVKMFKSRFLKIR